MLRYVVIAGPTASGKSAAALELALELGGEIVNADSRQIYRHMDIGTAKPSAAERARVRHHLYDLVDPDQDFDAARYRDAARASVAEIAARGRLPIVVGGTGLYLRALTRGLFAGPRANPVLRRVLADLEAREPGTLRRWCRRLDPELAARLHPNDRVRQLRGLEVVVGTGRHMSSLQDAHGFGDTFGAPLFFVLDVEARELGRRIAERSRAMFEHGLVEEVRALHARGFGPELRVLQSIGYRQAARFLAGELTLEQATLDLDRATRRFAKRQRTWFRSEPGTEWIAPARVLKLARVALLRKSDDVAAASLRTGPQ